MKINWKVIGVITVSVAVIINFVVLCSLGYDIMKLRYTTEDINRQYVISNLLWQRQQNEILSETYEQIHGACVRVINLSAGTTGSGTIIKLDKDYYVISCGHMVKTPKDNFQVKTKEGVLVDVRFLTLNQAIELSLYKVISSPAKLQYVLISQETPKVGYEVVVIGYPSNFNNILTDGIISEITEDSYTLTNITACGSSGSGVFYRGKLIGVFNSIYELDFYKKLGCPKLGKATKLEVIKKFLLDYFAGEKK